MATAGKHRSDKDVLRLIESNYEVKSNNGLKSLTVKFHGPQNTLYENGVWMVRVEMGERYPFEPPQITFLNKIFHPNIDEISGNVCLDVLNQKWSAMFDLINIFETFLPQLLTYPNPKDPLNSDAGIMYEEDLQAYEIRVRDYIELYASEPPSDNENKRFRGDTQESPASPTDQPKSPEAEEDDYSSESSMSDEDDAAGSSAGRKKARRNKADSNKADSDKAGSSSEPKKPPSATITSPVDDEDDKNTIEHDRYFDDDEDDEFERELYQYVNNSLLD